MSKGGFKGLGIWQWLSIGLWLYNSSFIGFLPFILKGME